MKKVKPNSIKRQIVLGGFLLIGLICFVILVSSSILSMRAFKAQVEEDMSVSAEQVSERLSAEISNAEKIVEELAANAMLSDDEFDTEDVVKFYEDRAKKCGFTLFFKVDKRGKGVNLTQTGETFDVSRAEYFKQSVQGKTYTSSIINDELTGDKIMVISTPYYNAYTGEFLGVFAGIKKSNFISEMCADFKWGETGNIAVYDKDTNIVGHTNFSIVESGLNLIEKAKTDSEYKGVAEEIRKLAEQSAGFTAEIRAVINDLKAKAESAVSMMENQRIMVDKQSEKVTETSDKFEEISKAVENSKVIVEEIHKASKTIEEENQNVVKVVENLSAIAEENAATTEESAASVDTQVQSIHDISKASENLAEIATDLQGEVSKFAI